MDNNDYFLPYEIIEDENYNNKFIDQYKGYVDDENYNNDEIYVGSDVKRIVNKIKKNNQSIKKLNNKNLIFNSRKNKDYEFIEEDFSNEETDSDTNKTNSINVSYDNEIVKNLKIYFYCLILGILIIFLIFIILKIS